MSDELRNRVRTMVRYYCRKAEDFYRIALNPLPLRFDLRGRAAGQAVLGCGEIRINATLLEQFPDHVVNVTVPHEVAHLVVRARWGREARPHGPEWQSVMRAFGVEPNRCHTLPAEPTRKVRREVHHCACGEHEITTIRANRIRRGYTYSCTVCGSILVAGPAPA